MYALLDAKLFYPIASIPQNKFNGKTDKYSFIPADAAAAAIVTEGIPMMKKGRAAA